MRVRFHPAALAELAHETRYYADIHPRLGERFATSVERAVDLAARFPEMGAPYKYRTRRVFPKRFPFSVIYLCLQEEVHVLAIAPFERKPGYWRDRAAGS